MTPAELMAEWFRLRKAERRFITQNNGLITQLAAWQKQLADIADIAVEKKP